MAGPDASATPSGAGSLARRACAGALLGMIRAYQVTLSPLVGRTCRFLPTCSSYAQDAIRLHGPWRGSLLAGRRLLRCHPWGGSGYDPVPPAGPAAVDHARSP